MGFLFTVDIYHQGLVEFMSSFFMQFYQCIMNFMLSMEQCLSACCILQSCKEAGVPLPLQLCRSLLVVVCVAVLSESTLPTFGSMA